MAPLLFGEIEPVNKKLMTQGLWAIALWGPGVAAIFMTVFIMKQPLKNLRFNRFNPGGNSISAEMIIAAQVLLAFTLAPFINILFALGEELGWR